MTLENLEGPLPTNYLHLGLEKVQTQLTELPLSGGSVESNVG